MLKPRAIFVRTLALAAGLLVLKVTSAVVLAYRDYFPPNFHSDFLRTRDSYFFGPYAWAFYAHIFAGPLTLLLGLVLLSDRLRLRFPRWHRSLGKIQVATVLLVLCPTGLWMARYAMTGPVAGVAFALLAIATAVCIVKGWRSAVARRFAEHRRWMWRCFLLLASAVVIRVIGGMFIVTEYGTEWSYPAAAWVSWLAPLGAFEIGRFIRWQRQARTPLAAGSSLKTAAKNGTLARAG